MSGFETDVQKCCNRQIRERTDARASENVGLGLEYQAVEKVVNFCSLKSWSAQSVTMLKRAMSTGVERAMPMSDHWRYVSAPRCARTSSKVTSTCHRLTKWPTMSIGVISRSVL